MVVVRLGQRQDNATPSLPINLTSVIGSLTAGASISLPTGNPSGSDTSTVASSASASDSGSASSASTTEPPASSSASSVITSSSLSTSSSTLSSSSSSSSSISSSSIISSSTTTPSVTPSSTSTHSSSSTVPSRSSTVTPSPSSVSSESSPSPSSSPTSLGVTANAFVSVTTTPPPSSAGATSFQTTITSRIVITTDGRVITTETAIPTTLSSNQANSDGGPNHAVAIGSTVGAVVLLFILLGALALWRRKQLRARLALFRRTPKSRTALLADEFDDSDEPPHALRYRDDPLAAGAAGSSMHSKNASSVSLAPRLAWSPAPPTVQPWAAGSLPWQALAVPGPASPVSPPHPRRQESGSGSLFHEDVWPPPGSNSRSGSQSDVRAGGETTPRQASVRSLSVYSTSSAGQGPSRAPSWAEPASAAQAHVRDPSAGEGAPLLTQAGQRSPSKVMWLDRKDPRKSVDMEVGQAI